jgi:hypothetical protein
MTGHLSNEPHPIVFRVQLVHRLSGVIQLRGLQLITRGTVSNPSKLPASLQQVFDNRGLDLALGEPPLGRFGHSTEGPAH